MAKTSCFEKGGESADGLTANYQRRGEPDKNNQSGGLCQLGSFLPFQ
jgi:hypothetical protein